ncbi:MAG: gamma carbonic anhydrase family protein [Planctomycetota bacterium]|nr:MAG: gamma carbonic anhydrase family protein [Planctomycetota bacterium]
MATVIGDVRIEAEASIWPGAVLRGDDEAIRIGPLTSIQDGTVVHTTVGRSPTRVGAKVTVGHGAILHSCIIEDECLIGMGATVLDDAVVGSGSLVGACALVTPGTKIPPGSLVLGVPAKVVRPVSEKERAMIDEGWREYQQRGAEYRARDAGQG